MIKSIQFTAIYVSDPEQAQAFWVDKLGFRVLQNVDLGGGNRFVMVAPPGGGTALVMSKPFGEGVKVGGPTGIAFLSDNIQATYDELVAKGVAFVKQPTKQPWGGSEAVFADPDGNLFMLH